MSRGRQAFTQTTITKALKGAANAGVKLAGFTLLKDGTIRFDVDDGSAAHTGTTAPIEKNEWDAV
jgi:hypothetical protein